MQKAKCPKVLPVIRENTELPENITDSVALRALRHFDAWKIPCNLYPFTIYPNYTSGHGYIISAHLSRDLYTQAKYTHIFPIEDAYVTGVLRVLSRISSTLVCKNSFSRSEKPFPYIGEFPARGMTYERAPKLQEIFWRYFKLYGSHGDEKMKIEESFKRFE